MKCVFVCRMEKKYRLVYRKSECIGAGACEAAYPEAWIFDKETSIATLKSEKTIRTDEREELEFGQEEFDKFLESAQVCPVMIIEVFDQETGKRVFPEE